jgi:uncharacterized protein
VLAVPVAGLAGVALPSCECSAVPIAGRLVARGAKPAAALTFLLAAPAVNPIVLVATLVAFPGPPQIALARFVASLAAAIIVGLLWQRVGALLDRARRRVVDGGSPWRTFVATAQHDFLHAGGFLVVGGLTAATLQVAVPRSVLASGAQQPKAVVADRPETQQHRVDDASPRERTSSVCLDATSAPPKPDRTAQNAEER